MVIKNVNLETVCGITSTLPRIYYRKWHLQANQM